MTFPFSKKSRSRVFAVATVSASAIEAAAFSYTPGEPIPRPLKKFTVRLPARATHDALPAKLHELIFSVAKFFERIPSRITVAVRPPIARYAITEWNLSAYHGRVTSPADLNRLFRNIFEQKKDPAAFSEAFCVETFFNGYPKEEYAAAPEVITEVAFRALIFSLPKEIGDRLTAVKSSLGGIPVTYVPIIIPQADAIVERLNLPDAFLIDISEEETILTRIRTRRIIATASFPAGVKPIIENVVKATAASYDEARDLERQHTDSLLNDLHTEHLASPLADGLKNWYDQFVASLDALYSAGPLPSNVLVTGVGAALPELRALLLKGDWLKKASNASAPTLRTFEGRSVFGGDTLGGFATGTADSDIAALAFYTLHSMIEES